MLRFEKFRKSYGHSLILKIDDAEIKPGLYWIKGVNGSGKSTLLKTLGGILHFEGNVFLDHHLSLKKNAIAYRKLVNFAQADPAFPQFLTGNEMIRLFSSAKNAPDGQGNTLVEEMKMDTYVNEPISTYSSGMLKKLSLVLAFIGNPKIILLDEPLITMDTESLKILYKWIAEKNKDGVSFFLSSHQTLETNRSIPLNEIVVERQTLNFLS